MAKDREIFVVAEQVSGQLAPVGFELLGAARKLAQESGGAEVSAVIMGYDIAGLADELFGYGADRVYLADDRRLQYYQNAHYALFLTDFFRRKQPDMVLWGATAIGGELAATVAAQLKTGLSAHCTDLYINADGLLVQVVPAFGGKVLGDILCPQRRPQMATVRPGIFSSQPVKASKSEIINEDTKILDGFMPPLKTVRMVKDKGADSALKEADFVVAGGWGVGSTENWQLLRKLSELLGGAVGCTRPALDEGWADDEGTMIGTSGISIKPKLYLGVGISGAVHHVVGIKDAGIIISINKDARAPIFSYSDYGIVADFRKILPDLIKAVEALV